MSKFTRRGFIAATSFYAAGVTVGARLLHGMPVRLDGNECANDIFPEPSDAFDLETLASKAVDAATSAGASFADIRIAEQHSMRVNQVSGQELIPDVELKVFFTYGIRAFVDGIPGFVYGTATDPAKIIASAQQAVAAARTHAVVARAKGLTRGNELGPAVVAKGKWQSPIKIDPFTVPIENQIALMWACQNAATRVPGAVAQPGSFGFNWIRENRTYASSEGSLASQTFYRSRPYMSIIAGRGYGDVLLELTALSGGTGGYETLLAPDLQDSVKATAEESVRFARLPERSMGVGRYPVVFDGATFGSMLAIVAGKALELDRVLGDEAGASGTSFLSPVEESLGAENFSSLLNVSAHRNLPAINAVKWDDEGVESREYPVITAGRVVNYHTSRANAQALEKIHNSKGLPFGSGGCAVSPEADKPVLARAPHLSAHPAAQDISIDELCKDIPHGILVTGANWGSVFTDQRLASGTLSASLIFEVERGKIVARIKDAAVQYNTKGLWKSLAAVGGKSTLRTTVGFAHKGLPWHPADQSVTAPAGLFRNTDVISTGRKL